MKVIVCLKPVPDTSLPLSVTPERKVSLDQVNYAANPYDEYAVEEAVRIKERGLADEVISLTIGGAEAEKAIRGAYAMGVDRAFLISPEGWDPFHSLLAAEILSAAIKRISFGLVLMGRQAVDDDGMAVPFMVAERMGVPVLGLAQSLELDTEKSMAVITRALEGGVTQKMQSSLPCIVTCQKDMNQPRYPSLPGMMRAKKKAIESLSLEDLGIGTAPTQAQYRGFEVAGAGRKNIMLEGTAEENCLRLVKYLREDEKVID